MSRRQGGHAMPALAGTRPGCPARFAHGRCLSAIGSVDRPRATPGQPRQCPRPAPLLQRDQPRLRPPEPTGPEMEPSQLWLEVDVQPLTTGGAGFAGGDRDEFGADTAAASAGGGHGVEEEGMDIAVPDDLDEAEE